MAANDQQLRDTFAGYAVVVAERKERRDALKSLLFGIVWLCFVCKEQDRERMGRTLRLATETDEEKVGREEQEERDGRLSKNNPCWIRNAVYCSKKILELAKSQTGPATAIVEAFPYPILEDCAAMASMLLEIALANGLGKETSAELKSWLGMFFVKLPLLRLKHY